MAELSKKAPEIPLASGTRTLGVACKACGEGIGLGGKIFPPSFEAKCTTCQETRTYQLDEVIFLTVASIQ